MDSIGKLTFCCLFGIFVALQVQASEESLHREDRQYYTTPPPCPHGEVHDLLEQGRAICRTCWMGCCRTCNNEEDCTAFLDIFFIEAFQQCMIYDPYNTYQLQKCCDARGNHNHDQELANYMNCEAVHVRFNLETLLSQLQRMCSGRRRPQTTTPVGTTST